LKNREKVTVRAYRRTGSLSSDFRLEAGVVAGRSETVRF
jgi:hypothetical protein